MICPWAGGAVRYRPVLTGPVAIPGIVLFLGAAIPGDIPHIGSVGTSPGLPSPRHYARNARKGPSESGSGPAPKPRSRACPSARSRPPRVSAPVGIPARSPVATVSTQAEPTRRTTPEAAPSRGLPDLLTRWPSSSRCREWLERLDRGELVVVNLRPETDPETEYVAFDRPRVLRVLSHIIADSWPDTRRSPTRSRPQSRTPRPGVPATGDGWRSPTPPPKRLSDTGRTGGLMGRSGPSAS